MERYRLHPHGSDSIEQALRSLRGVGIDSKGVDVLFGGQGFESRELSVQDREVPYG